MKTEKPIYEIGPLRNLSEAMNYLPKLPVGAVKYDSCGGCGADHPSQRCIGCFHPFEEIARLNARPPEGGEGSCVCTTPTECAAHGCFEAKTPDATAALVDRLVGALEEIADMETQWLAQGAARKALSAAEGWKKNQIETKP